MLIDENPIWHRTLTVYVDVYDNWLDPDRAGTDEAREEGWEQIKTDMVQGIQMVYHRHGKRPTYPKTDVGWEDHPELA